MMKKQLPFLAFAFAALLAVLTANTQAIAAPAETEKTAAQKPNIIVIYTDDVGYGDLSCYGATRVQTPNIDQLAKDGLRFTNVFAAAATCTPSRYGILTGEYPWRQAGRHILPGDANLLIKPGTFTIAEMLKQAGYTTGAIGKWHLGFGKGKIDWNKEVTPGPRDVGFDYSFLMPATLDRVPTVFLENQRVVGLNPKDPIEVDYKTQFEGELTGKEHPELLKMKPTPGNGHDGTIVNGISRIGHMKGGEAARWVDENIADTLMDRATKFIERSRAQPFFLYLAMPENHVPRAPNARFVGKTEMGPRGDSIVELDWCVGEVMKTLDRLKLADHTLVIFSSDNGPVVNDGYLDQSVQKLGSHKPAGPFRGGKYSAFDGGTAEPFILSWPRHVRHGVSTALISQVDLLASFAALTGQKLPDAAAPDSFNMLPALLGETETGRDYLIQEGGPLCVRTTHWKYITPSGGPKLDRSVNIETGRDTAPQLYDITQDKGERTNVAAEHPEKVAELAAILEKVKTEPKSRP